jgi:hypothetical protein
MLMWFFYEALYPLLITLFVVNFLLLAWWRRGGSKRPLQAGLVLSVLLLAGNVAITTDREQAAQIMGRLEQAFETDDLAPLREYVAADFSARGYNRTDFLELVERWQADTAIGNIVRRHLDIERRTEDIIIVDYHCAAQIESQRHGGGWIVSMWRLSFRETPAGWRLYAIDLEETMPPTNVNVWRAP